MTDTTAAQTEHHKGGVGFYIFIALVLGAVTYAEFAMIQYVETFAFLSVLNKVLLLIGMSVAKFFLVVAIYMHLRDDDNTYTGFFVSGLIIALGTFVALSFLFTGRSMVNLQNADTVISATDETAHEAEVEEGHGLSGEVLRSIESGGKSRPLAERLLNPPPKDLGGVPPLSD